MSDRVFVTRKIADAGIQLLSQTVDCDVWQDSVPPSREQLLERSRGCSGLLTMLSDSIDGELMDAIGSQLKVVCNYAVGYNNIDVAAAEVRNVAVGNTPDVLTDATADLAVTLLLAAARRVPEGIQNVADHEWKTWEPLGLIGSDLKNATVGIVGMGRIGFATARRLHGGWEMNVLYTARSDKAEANQELSAQRVSFDELLKRSDFISIHTDLNPNTAGLFDSKAFEAMKPTAVLVNTARGAVIDQEALAIALRRRTIFAAGLDVTDPEPLAADSGLRGLPNCVILPHIGSATGKTRNDMAEIAARNILAGLAGRDLPCPVIHQG